MSARICRCAVGSCRTSLRSAHDVGRPTFQGARTGRGCPRDHRRPLRVDPLVRDPSRLL